MTAVVDEEDQKYPPINRVRPTVAQTGRRSASGSSFSPFGPLDSDPPDERTMHLPALTDGARRPQLVLCALGAALLAAIISISVYIGVTIGTQRALAAARKSMAPVPVAAPEPPVLPAPENSTAKGPSGPASPSLPALETKPVVAVEGEKPKPEPHEAAPEEAPEEEPVEELPPLPPPRPRLRRPLPRPVITAEALPPTPVLTMDPYRRRGPQYVVVQPSYSGTVEVYTDQIR